MVQHVGEHPRRLRMLASKGPAADGEPRVRLNDPGTERSLVPTDVLTPRCGQLQNPEILRSGLDRALDVVLKFVVHRPRLVAGLDLVPADALHATHGSANGRRFGRGRASQRRAAGDEAGVGDRAPIPHDPFEHALGDDEPALGVLRERLAGRHGQQHGGFGSVRRPPGDARARRSLPSRPTPGRSSTGPPAGPGGARARRRRRRGLRGSRAPASPEARRGRRATRARGRAHRPPEPDGSDADPRPAP